MAADRPAFWETRTLPAPLLLPLSGLFWALAALRRGLFTRGLLKAVRLPVPVVVVGNITVGGSGKTPAVLALAAALREAGYKPGIISRGYGSRIAGEHEVGRDDDPAQCGDEPLLLARCSGCPVVIGADRPAAARCLLARRPECDVLISDDGLQHYRLLRDAEVIVVDEAVLGNRWLLPAGPLREGVARLREATVIIAHGPLSAPLRAGLGGVPVFPMTLRGTVCRNLATGEWVGVERFRGRRVHALAGIGRPERFFQQLRQMGLTVAPHPFADHHEFGPRDLAFAPGEPKIMTAKDAVKCAPFASAEVWEFPVTAQIDPSAWQHILEMLKHGRPLA